MGTAYSSLNKLDIALVMLRNRTSSPCLSSCHNVYEMGAKYATRRVCGGDSEEVTRRVR